MCVEAMLLSEQSLRFLKNRGEDYLLEVFRLWDCYGQKWVDEDTMQLRFETADLLVGRDPSQEAGRRNWEALTGIEGVQQGSSVGLVSEGAC